MWSGAGAEAAGRGGMAYKYMVGFAYQFQVQWR